MRKPCLAHTPKWVENARQNEIRLRTCYWPQFNAYVYYNFVQFGAASQIDLIWLSFFRAHFHQCFSIQKCMQLTERQIICGPYRAGQHVVRPAVSREGVGKCDDERRLNRLWARPFDSSSSCTASRAQGRRRRKRRRWKEAVGRKEGYTKYGGKRDDGATRNEKEKNRRGDRRELRGEWDEKFSLASLRCLYTRGSCMAMGHISVLRERGAPPKNQIECKNRINSSCKLESYVRSAWFSLKAFSLSLSLRFISFSHTLYLKPCWSFSLSLLPISIFFFFATRSTRPLAWLHLARKGRSPPVFSFILLVCQHESYAVSRAYEGSVLYR